MDATAAKENDRRLFQYFNERNMVAVDQWIDEHVSKDFVNHSTHFGGSSDKNGLKEIFRKFAELDMTIELGEMVFEDNVLCFRTIIHIGGQPVSAGIAMVKFKDDKIAERWAFSDDLKTL
ncbi:MAG: ester cyclase [Elainella sp. Prado103]|jgi:hypothetical protein|nr:ester cyclase [Elainella sp. Prado103]